MLNIFWINVYGGTNQYIQILYNNTAVNQILVPTYGGKYLYSNFSKNITAGNLNLVIKMKSTNINGMVVFIVNVSLTQYIIGVQNQTNVTNTSSNSTV
jgi:hypothetical protein